MQLPALVITAPGINCDLELCRAFELAGATVETIHLQRLSREPALVDRFRLIGLPGGFSYGDDIAAGRVMAQLMRHTVYPALAAAIARGVPMITPCNGFQIAVQAGLLPGPSAGARWPDEPAAPTVALMQNVNARFHDGWTRFEVPAETRCIWTRGLRPAPGTDLLPSAHGEGRFVTDEDTLAQLKANGQVAIRYVASDNFNGSIDAIAGICDATGLVLGLMPHPERYTRWTHHPWWTRLSPALRQGDPPGLAIFRQAVAHASRVSV
ncbi:MAG: phosphoribosylformylglycinamidine synthase subunit PurQ [Phycisphaerae bacterium]|nr:phosphoribosylformylglycinamidine synthase subunit PurQ [Phycisphaerae bacterium]